MRGDFENKKNQLKNDAQVSQEGPFFATDSKFGDLLIVVVPRHGPSIIGARDRWQYQLYDRIRKFMFFFAVVQVPGGRADEDELHFRGEIFTYFCLFFCPFAITYPDHPNVKICLKEN